MSKTNAFEDAILDHALGTSAYTFPSQCYLALYTSNPTETGAAGTEVSGGSYARQPIDFYAASGGTTSNNGDVTFPQATASWGTVSHFGIFDALAGTMIYYGALTTARSIATDDILIVEDGALTVSED